MWRRASARSVVIGMAIVVFTICSVLPLVHLLVTAVANAYGAQYASLLLDVRQRGSCTTRRYSESARHWVRPRLACRSGLRSRVFRCGGRGSFAWCWRHRL